MPIIYGNNRRVRGDYVYWDADPDYPMGDPREGCGDETIYKIHKTREESFEWQRNCPEDMLKWAYEIKVTDKVTVVETLAGKDRAALARIATSPDIVLRLSKREFLEHADLLLSGS